MILAYHRVTELESDPQLLAVTPARFRKQLEYLAAHYQVWSVDAVADALRTGEKLPDNWICLTFDDGYQDNLRHAAPIAAEADMTPLTIFPVSGMIDTVEEPWWDELECLLLCPGRLPQDLCLQFPDTTYRRDLGVDAEIQSSPENPVWTVLNPKNPTRRHEVYRELHQLLRPLS
ncbi:MAG: polysaccharide deacetylase family protein, partial [Pseudomonadales bacterium]|nr:polysaccharide deacetylase family protein [Pseudomonadales bacterium]